jgi:hypothetical protein
MIISKPFWTRTKGTIKTHFSYDKVTQAAAFASKYGGTVENQLEVPDDLGPEIFSVLYNSTPIPKDFKDKKFQVYVRQNDQYVLHNSYTTISEANTEAKNLIPTEIEVIVVKK